MNPSVITALLGDISDQAPQAEQPQVSMPAAPAEATAPAAPAEQEAAPPAENTAAAAPDAESAPLVLNFAKERQRLGTAAALDKSGVFHNAPPLARGQASFLKRIVRALYREDELSNAECNHSLRALQNEYKTKLASQDVETLAKQGDFGKLVKRYLAILIKQNEANLVHLVHDPLKGEETNPLRLIELENDARDRVKKNTHQLQWYESDASAIDQAALAHPQVIRMGKNLPFDAIAAHVIAGEDPEKLKFYLDMTSDISCVQATRAILSLQKELPDDEAMTRYTQDAALNEARIQAIAMRVAKATRPLSPFDDFEAPTPEAAAIFAAKDLLMAQLRQTTMQLRTKEEMAVAEAEAQKLVKQYAEAMVSLTLDYLGEGAAQSDGRIATVAANLREEAQLQGIPCTMDRKSAHQQLAALARKSAEDLMQTANGNDALKRKLTKLVEAAGGTVNEAQPLKPTPQIIGIPIVDALKTILADPKAIDLPSAITYMQDVVKGKTAAPQLAASA